MVVLVAALALGREAAVAACNLICHKLVRPELSREVTSSAEEALLRYQAVPRLCKLLGADLPALPAPEADLDKGMLAHKFSTYKWVWTEFRPKSEIILKSSAMTAQACRE